MFKTNEAKSSSTNSKPASLYEEPALRFQKSLTDVQIENRLASAFEISQWQGVDLRIMKFWVRCPLPMA